ncbi:hypothetical protein BSKO_11654 [Bryopsis sp. KO-2023]|nr:hypothetical protein BSKO_11654 [Bryopsis sp. KO-2023]
MQENFCTLKLGFQLINLLKAGCMEERPLLLRVIAKVAAWRGHVAKQIGVKQMAQELWGLLQKHHGEIRDFMNRPPPPVVDVEQTPPKKKGKGKEKDPQPTEEAQPGLKEEELIPLLKGLATFVSFREDIGRAIYEHDFQSFWTLLEHPSHNVRVCTLRLVYSLTRNGDIRKCLCDMGIIKTLLTFLDAPGNPEDEPPPPEFTRTVFKVLKRLSADSGARQVELMQENMLERAMEMVAGHESDDQGGIPTEEEAILQEEGMELVLEMTRKNKQAAEQAVACGILDVITAILPEPHPEIVARYSGAGLGEAGSEDPNTPSNTVFAALQSHRSREDLPITPEEQKGPEVKKYRLPSRRTLSSNLQALCLRVFEVLLKQDKIWGHSAENAPSLPWHLFVMFFMESKGLPEPEPPEEEEEPAAPAKGKKGKAKGKEQAVDPDAGPPKEFLPPFPEPVRAAACYSLHELAKEASIANLLLESPGLPSLLLRVGSTTKSWCYPRDANHPVALLISTLTTHIVRSRNEAHRASSLEDSKLVDALGTLSRRLLESQEEDRLSITKRQVSRAALGMGADLFQPLVRPPLKSPPPTPPPPLLPTSQFIWDTLGRPVMTDGLTLRTL